MLKTHNVWSKLRGFPSDLHKDVTVWHGPQRHKKLRLDHGFAYDGGKGPVVNDGLVVVGDLMVDGPIWNGEQDFGPFLIVLGNLTVTHMAVAGAPIYVFGKLTVTGVCHGYYNHGQLHVFGDANINLLLADDYAVTVTGKARGKLVNLGYVKARGFEKHAAPNVLAARYYQADGEPPDVEYILKSGALYDALRQGKRVER